jgi:hypothetical protein
VPVKESDVSDSDSGNSDSGNSDGDAGIRGNSDSGNSDGDAGIRGRGALHHARQVQQDDDQIDRDRALALSLQRGSLGEQYVPDYSKRQTQEKPVR